MQCSDCGVYEISVLYDVVIVVTVHFTVFGGVLVAVSMKVTLLCNVVSVVNMKFTVLCDVLNVVTDISEEYSGFLLAVEMKAARFFETSSYVYQTTRRHIT